MKLRSLSVLFAIVAVTTVLVAPPAGAQEVPVPGSCLIARAGYSDLAVIDADTCVGRDITNCQVKVTAFIAGRFGARGKDARAHAGCGNSFVTAHAEVPNLGGVDDDEETSGVGSPMQPCTFDHPGGGSPTLWYVSCQYTFVEP